MSPDCGETIEAARDAANALADKVVVPNARYRRDIGTRLIEGDFAQLEAWGCSTRRNMARGAAARSRSSPLYAPFGLVVVFLLDVPTVAFSIAHDDCGRARRRECDHLAIPKAALTRYFIFCLGFMKCRQNV